MQKKGKRFLINATITLLILVTICTTFPTLWGPFLMGRIAHAFLPKKEGVENHFVIKRIGIGGIEVIGIHLATVAFAPSCDYFLVRYTPWGLLNRRIDSVEVRGLVIDPMQKGEQRVVKRVVGQRNHSLGGETVLKKPYDPLCGWGIRRASIETREIDFSSLLPKQVRPLFPSSKVNFTFTLEEENGAMVGKLKGDVFGLPLGGNLGYRWEHKDLMFSLNYPDIRTDRMGNQFGQEARYLLFNGQCNFYDLDGFSWESTAKVCYYDEEKYMVFANQSEHEEASSVPEMDFHRIELQLNASGHENKGIQATIKTSPEVIISSEMPFVTKILPLIPMPKELTEIDFRSKVVVKANLTMTESVPKWEVSVVGSVPDARFELSKIPFSIKDGRIMVKCEGVGDFWRMRPIFVTLSEAQVGLFSFGRGNCTLYTDENMLVMPKATIEFCGGQIVVYSLNFGYEKANSGFTLELDRLDAGEFIRIFPKIEGSTATGRLYGKMPLRIEQKGTEVRLGEAFLYSPPGEVGNIQIKDPAVIIQLLASVGVPESVCENLGKALQNLDYQTLRFDLQNPRTEEGILAVKLEGSSSDRKVTTPVHLNIKVNGPIERMLNLSLKTAKIGK